MTVSIIIPCRWIDGLTRKCVKEILRQDYKDFEIILLPDEKDDLLFPQTTIIATGPIRPAEKRNLGIKKAKGDIITFIDSDAYPEKGWMKEAVKIFKRGKGIAGVGGPNLTPIDSNLKEIASGDIFASWVTSGKFAARYSIKKEEPHAELPSCNLFFRRQILVKLGGFDKSLLTGEDAKLCFQINNTGKKIIYSPLVRVRHKRRPLYYPHLRQVFVYGRDKASLVKELFPAFLDLVTPNRLVYLFPSFFLLFISFGLVGAIFNTFIRGLWLVVICFYFILVSGSYFFGVQKLNLLRFIYFLTGVPLTHFAYGAGFIYGLTSSRVKGTLNKR